MWTCKNCGATPIDDSKQISFECMTPSEIKPLRVIPANSGVSNSIFEDNLANSGWIFFSTRVFARCLLYLEVG